jgi:hypothetical protein
MLTNDLKKGMMVTLNNGWKARIEDNKKGNIRMATVYGIATEMGSIYASDITNVMVNAQWIPVIQTAAQVKAYNTRKSFGF